MNSPKVVIIVLHWNTYEDTKECLESLQEATYPNFTVMLVDNGSHDNSGFSLRDEFPSVHFVRNDENLGYPAGNNVGIDEAMEMGADYVVLLNSDVTVDKYFLDELVSLAESDSTIGIVGSKILFYFEPKVMQTTGGKINWWLGSINNFGGPDDGRYDEVAERDYVYGTCMLIKKAVVERIGGLDPQFFFSIEEYDYCPRARQAGFKTMYAPTSKIWHKKGASAKKLVDYPETLEKVSEKAGMLMWKYHWDLFRKHVQAPFYVIPFTFWLLRTIKKVTWRILNRLFKGDIKPFIYAIRRIWYRMKLALTK